jgi:hypothetical protein
MPASQWRSWRRRMIERRPAFTRDWCGMVACKARDRSGGVALPM